MTTCKTIGISTDDFARALNVAETFNIKSGVRPNRRVKAVLEQAADFLLSLQDDLAAGKAIHVGSAWGSDKFLDRNTARALARSKARTAYLSGTVGLELPQRDAAKLSSIRRAFALSSDRQAASLALRVYQQACDNLWRGNSFSLEDKAGKITALDTDKMKTALTFKF